MRPGLTTLPLCLLLAGPGWAEPRQYGQARAVVVRVCDGDTVVVDIPDYPDVVGKGIRVRLAGVDAPELRDPDPDRRRAGQAAKRAMAALLPPGSPVMLTNIRRDKYFRLDADIRFADRDVAGSLGLRREGERRRGKKGDAFGDQEGQSPSWTTR
jgi:micrococcal nuclease